MAKQVPGSGPRPRRRSLLVVLTAALWLGAPAGAGQADEPIATGWWTDLRSEPLGDATRAAHPDVPDDGLLVQGGVDGPSAYAALRYVVPPGAVVGPLVLEVEADSGTVASSAVLACELTGTFTPAQGGPMAEAPPYDCERAAAGVFDGATFQFDVASLVGPGGLAIALVPGGAGDRAVFSRPGSSSLAVSPAPATRADGVPQPQPERAAPRPLSRPTVEFTAPSSEELPPLPLPVAVDRTVEPAPTARSLDPTLVPPAALPAGVVGDDGGGQPLFFVGLAAAVALWLGAGRLFGARTPVDPPVGALEASVGEG